MKIVDWVQFFAIVAGFGLLYHIINWRRDLSRREALENLRAELRGEVGLEGTLGKEPEVKKRPLAP
jgi:hypothetical protein